MSLERKIAKRFAEIEGIGWFPEALEAGSVQFRILQDALQPAAGMRILDVGCARGRFLRELVPSGADLFGIDLTPVFVHAACRNVPEARFTHGSLSALPFAAATFDAVYCIETLQHLEDTSLALHELARVLRPGGTLLIIDRNALGLDARNGLPASLTKILAERRGKWMYSPDFGFRERWFRPGWLAARMREFCDPVRIRFIHEKHGRASHLYRLLPFLSCDVAWLGRRIG